MESRSGEVVATAVTNIDLHDISRSCRTYGVKSFYAVTPIETQHGVVQRIIDHWRRPENKAYHPDRYEALSRLKLAKTFEEVLKDVQAIHPESRPEVVLTDARESVVRSLKSVTYSRLRSELMMGDSESSENPVILVFGTGWGTANAFYPVVDRVLEPIYGLKTDGEDSYNHLSVRSAVAIILDRLTHDRNDY